MVRNDPNVVIHRFWWKTPVRGRIWSKKADHIENESYFGESIFTFN
jgi:hypothetical protein